MLALPTWEGAFRAAGVRRAGETAAQLPGTVASGHPALDDVLPGGGWPRGALVELQLGTPGIGEIRLLAGALTAAERGGRVAFVDPPAEPVLSALQQLGHHAPAITVAHARDPRNRRWAAEQLLRSGAFAAVLAWWPDPLDDRTSRRLALALATGAGLGFVFGPPAAIANSAALRLGLRGAGPAALYVDVLKRRGPPVPPVRVAWT
ncbi:translesion DNA synthesis-associated protein ImuA [Rhodanobacter sp. FW106-PBR-LB-2-11]|uniref:translesion DNA synthesis-associated protein ImuA n=1 Tax=Rhodanobacter sp. FW106-PBR-LB-2-11 TaxID=1524463 RepID=UPI0034E4A27F